MKHPSFRSLASVFLVCALALACSAAPSSGGASPTPHPTTPEGLLPTLPPATQPAPETDGPPAAEPTPHPTTPDGSLLTPPPATQPAPETTEPDGPASGASVRGTWLGTIESNGSSQGIRFLLRDIGGVISGTALWDSGKIDNGLRGRLEGGVLTLDDVLVGGINFYEGTIEGDLFSGTHTTVPNLEGQAPSTFEAMREE